MDNQKKLSKWRKKEASKYNSNYRQGVSPRSRKGINEWKTKESKPAENWNTSPYSWQGIPMKTQMLSVKIQWHNYFTWKIAPWLKGVMN